MKTYLILFLFLASIFLVHFSIAKQAVYGDGIDYWTYLHSWYFDHDSNFINEYKHIYSPEFNNVHPEVEANEVQKTRLTVIGRADNPHPPGMAFLVFPFFILADWVIVVLNFFGVPILRNGYADLYQIFVGLGIIGYTVAGVWFLERVCHTFTLDKKSSKWAVTAVVLCSPLLYYGGYDVINSHALSFFLTSCFWFILFFRKKTLRWTIALGVVMGLAIMNRFQDVLLIVPFLLLVSRELNKNTVKQIIVVCTTIFFIDFPLLFVWQSLYGVPFPLFYLGPRTYQGIVGVFVHPINGIFTRSPLLLLALGGIALLWKQPKEKFRTVVLAIYLILNVVLIIYQSGWHDAAYGGRMFISILPVFAMFISVVFARLRAIKFSYFPAVLVGVAFIVNIVSATHFVLYEKQANSGDKTGLEQGTETKLRNLFPMFY